MEITRTKGKIPTKQANRRQDYLLLTLQKIQYIFYQCFFLLNILLLLLLYYFVGLEKILTQKELKKEPQDGSTCETVWWMEARRPLLMWDPVFLCPCSLTRTHNYHLRQLHFLIFYFKINQFFITVILFRRKNITRIYTKRENI